MSPKDYVGTYGENCFHEIMTRLHGRSEPFFRLNYLGEKQETVDFLVELVAPIPRACLFFVQVKTTRQVRTGGSLPIKLSREQISQMARSPIPAYVVAVNEHNGLAYILFVDQGAKSIGAFPTLFPLDRDHMERLWHEIKAFWETDTFPVHASYFTVKGKRHAKK